MADALARCSTSIVGRWFGPSHVLPVIAGSCEIVAANGVPPYWTNLRHGVWPAFVPSEAVTPRFDECIQDRQRQTLVVGFRHLVEFGGKRQLSREPADPFAVLVDETTKPPLRQFQREQRQPCVAEGASFDQSSDPYPRSRRMG